MEKPFAFFILSKGNNAGKPALVPWANCFMASCSNQEAKEFYFWLIYGLHNAGRFRVHHHGTAIQFLNIDDIQRVVKEIAPSILPQWQKFKNIVEALSKFEQKKATLAQQIIATEKLQKQLLNAYLFEAKAGV